MIVGSLKVFSGSSNPQLAKNICEFIGVRLGEAKVTCFPDGETFVQVNENIRGTDVFVVQSTCKPANHHIMELLIMIDALRRASAARITAVLPFYGYARQDRKDRPRVPITSKLVANLLVAAGANRILTMDLHAQQITGFFDIPVDHLFAAPVFFDYLKRYNKDNLTVCSPDIGGMKMAAAYADMFGCPLGVVAKRRTDAENVNAFDLIGEVKGREVILVDDMTESGGTLNAAAKLLKERGATKVRAVVSHGVLNEKGYERLGEGLLDELITTNSTPVEPNGLPITVLSVAELLGEAIMRAHHNESVTSLFKLKGY
tara:strand:- start:39307 stop:40254 length:948 start_codon:yes stop_codon:yes gene_type:complete